MADRCPKCRAKGFESGAEPCSECGWKDPILEPWVPAGWYYDPANQGMDRWWSYGKWVGKPHPRQHGRPIPTEKPADWAERERLGIREPPTWTRVVVTTSHELPNARIVRHQSEAFGLTVRTRNVFSNAIAGVRGIVGGEVASYTKLMQDARQESLDRLRQAADEVGANAVVSMRVGANQISEDMTEFVAYGSAVVVEWDKHVGEEDIDKNDKGF
jgi:uncharacterized protein YbjQ (UPF0145 family)